MAAKKPKPADVLEGFEPTPEEVEFDEFLEEVGPTTAVIHILRMKPDGSKPQIGKTTMDQIREDPWEFLRVTYGGGKYCLLFRGGNREFRGSKVMEVEGPAIVPGQSSAGASGVLSHEKLLDTMLLSMIQHFQPREIPPPPPALDIGALFAGMASMMTVLKPAAPAEKPPDPIAMFQTIMTMYQGMKDKNEKPPLEQLRDVATVIREFSGEKGGGEDSMWGAVASIGKDVIEKGSQILGNMRQPAAPVSGHVVPFQPAKPTAQFPTLPAALPATSEIPNQPAPGEAAAAHSAVTLSNTEKWIRVQIGSLKEKAKLNKNPEFWAEYILDNEEDYGPAALLYAVRQGATLETLIAFDPEIGSNPQLTWWFSEVFEGVKAGLNQPMDSGRQGGDEGDDLPNVTARPTGPNGTGSAGDSRPVPDTDVN